MKNKNNVTIGAWITLGHFSIAEIMARSGFDWLCIDLEHSVIDYLEAEQLISTIEANNCIPYVRIGKNDETIIKRVLDAGAKGLIIPMVNSVEDAEKAISSAKYPPNGNRGVGLARAQNYGFGFEQYLEKSNSDIKIILQIEHHKAISNINDILNVEGVDGTIIGPYDLSGSIGMPGQYNNSEVISLLNEYEKNCKKNDSPMGIHVVPSDSEMVIKKIKEGYSFIGFSLDTIFLGSNCRKQIQHIRKYLK